MAGICNQGVTHPRAHIKVLYEVVEFWMGGGWRRVSVNSYGAGLKCFKHSYKNYSENKNVNIRKQKMALYILRVKNSEPNWILSSWKDQVYYEYLHILQKE